MKRKKTRAEVYFKAYTILITLACLLLPFYEKGKFELIVNKAHTPILDLFLLGLPNWAMGLF
ncbi:hypothetical protein [Cyclobacterium qasimii]|uniref:hypothetical protein n=1 Tax=Cyclobacterium qasimii TaxID=1350429 RepID=UPI00058F8235|nr:hypothetical protein [Cyclobacterium qasimii]